MKKKKLIDIPEIIDDNFIIQFFIKNNKIIKTRVNHIFLDQYPDVKQYLENRYIDFNSYKETLYRIYNNINEIPLCSYCHNNKTKFYSFTKGYLKHCCSSCATLDPDVKEKLKNTNLEKYGCEHNWSNKDIRQKCIDTTLKRYGYKTNIEKIKQTNLKKYGVEFPYQYKEFLDKARNTCLKHFGVDSVRKDKEFQKQCYIKKLGVDNPFKLKSVKDKIRQTLLEKYNVEYALSNKDIRNKGIQTQKEKYNGLLYVQTQDFLNKSYNTKKLHKSFNTSKIENLFEQYLIDNNINYETQYKSDEYPFKSDFYIIDYNLYIEINAHWTHGFHLFNKDNNDDIQKLNEWKQKNTEFYNNAIKTWSIRDVNKYNIAMKNNLNYLVIYSNKINEVIEQFENYINKCEYNI